ncbi:MAG: valine--tRNA ligase [Kiritimatiellae bacterium]|nr:valine--tRNA ligase [Kiritimatiellia bacterium]
MMDKHYDPKAVEEKWYAWWESHGCFHAEPKDGGESYSIVIPPPNVTGILHMGHALNETIQDILTRWRRMQGRNVLWLPGTDHAGIATQSVVEKSLDKEHLRRQDLGREKFLERVWQWKEKYGGTIVHQQRKLGNSTDWQRERFTFDAGCSKAVTKVFVQLFKEGLIYKGPYIVNWCTHHQTALANDEVEHEENHGHLWYIRYPVVGSDKGVSGEPYRDYVMVATTRPETLPGDTAVAVNPKDERYAHLRGKKVILPLTGREIPVVEDDYVEKDFGTGIVKITPAHDPNDFLVGKRHDLPIVNVMNGDGTMNADSGRYVGMDRFVCREEIVKDLEAGGYLDHIEDYDNQVGHCYRCHKVVESRLSKQWFVKMKPLAEPAIAAVRTGEIQFVPKRWENVYFNWMENIQDWCISRQLWWGHRIPAYYLKAEIEAKAENPVFVVEETPEAALAAMREKTGNAALTAEGICQDEDVLDTWFSSWLWPFSTLGWPEQTDDLKFYYPTCDLVTAQDIIFFWVARMIMAGYHFMGQPPFRKIIIHGIVRDDQGRKMSKSLGNSLDPLELIDSYSADALRFSLALITSLETDSRVSKSKFEIGRNFATKIWNAARFMQMNLEKNPGIIDAHAIAAGDFTLDPALLRDDDRHVLWTLQSVLATMNDHLEKYRLQDGALAIYDLIWNKFCDWYLEYAKQDLSGEDEARRKQVLTLMTAVFSSALKLLHPYMPFVTEELWHQMGYGKDGESIMLAPWPTAYTPEQNQAWGLSQEIATYIDNKRELITAGRALRSDYNIAPSKLVTYLIQTVDDETARRFTSELDTLRQQLRAEEITITVGGEHLAMPCTVCKQGTIYLSLKGQVDAAAELERVRGELVKTRGFLKGVEAKLSNESFVSRAPEAIVQQQREKKVELEATIERLTKLEAAFAAAQ